MSISGTDIDVYDKLVIQDLSVRLGDRYLLRHASFSVKANHITAVIGPSGCGKSVLLKSLVGLLKDDSSLRIVLDGCVTLDGQDLFGLRERERQRLRRRLAYVSQHPTAFPGSVYDNIAIGLRYWRPELSKGECGSTIESVLREVRLWEEVQDVLKRPARDLSAGQLQRLCLARALVLRPEVLLLDEPCAYIDPIGTASLELLLQGLSEDRTILIVTHNLQQAARSSDYTFFMNAGEFVELGPTNAMFTHPKERRTEDYITGRFG